MASKARSGEVVRYDGARGTTFRIRYTDGSGKRIKETLGSEHEGWTERKAEEALQDRLSDVRRDGYRAPDRKETFGPFAEAWLPTYAETKGLKRSTRDSYRTIIEPARARVQLGSLPRDRRGEDRAPSRPLDERRLRGADDQRHTECALADLQVGDQAWAGRKQSSPARRSSARARAREGES